MESNLRQIMLEIADGVRAPDTVRGNYDDPFAALDLAASMTTADQNMSKLERIESTIKVVLADVLSKPVTGAVGRRLAAFQKQLGFLFKYKSYTMKCATPFGYSVFFHNRGEGFSFQRHVTHKTEVFHILSVKPDGYVFLCEHDEWKRIYDAASFDAWLSGNRDERYDRYRYQPAPGDVIVVDKLGTVHSVVGCVLAEYATASTDMVERLHDQNVHKTIPPEFTRANALREVHGVKFPSVARAVTISGNEAEKRDLPAVRIPGGTRTVLVDSFLTASMYQIEPGQQTNILRVDQDLAVVHVSSGTGGLVLSDEDEVASASAAPRAIELAAGDTAVIAPGLFYRFRNERDEGLTITEQRIRPSVCLI
jgi:mannose-6-phosphate isomerase-like protein (cupin superfamily)